MNHKVIILRGSNLQEFAAISADIEKKLETAELVSSSQSTLPNGQVVFTFIIKERL